MFVFTDFLVHKSLFTRGFPISSSRKCFDDGEAAELQHAYRTRGRAPHCCSTKTKLDWWCWNEVSAPDPCCSTHVRNYLCAITGWFK